MWSDYSFLWSDYCCNQLATVGEFAPGRRKAMAHNSDEWRTFAITASLGIVVLLVLLWFTDIFPPSIKLSAETGKVFHEHVTTTNVTRASVEMELAVGSAVPADVTLNPVPLEIIEGAPELEGHEFFVVGDRIHVVDPKTQSIVTIIE